MKEIKLQPRLNMIASLVPIGARIADIGTDHGYLPTYLIQNKKIEYAIASDINILPLEHAKATAKEYGISNIDFILCNGIDQINIDSIDTIIIAGMGGDVISGILSSLYKKKKLILQPMSKQEYLRSWLNEHCFLIEREVLVEDKNHIYPIMIVKNECNQVLTDAEKYLGLVTPSDPLFKKYYNSKIQKLDRINNELMNSRNMEEQIQKNNTLKSECMNKYGYYFNNN